MNNTYKNYNTHLKSRTIQNTKKIYITKLPQQQFPIFKSNIIEFELFWQIFGHTTKSGQFYHSSSE